MTLDRRVLCCAMLIAMALAPRALAGQTRMTLMGGMANTRLSGSGVDDYVAMKERRGLYVLVTADIPILGSPVAIAPGGAFIEKGFRWGDAAIEYGLKLSYLEVVAPLRLAVDVAGPIGVSAFAGPGFGLGFGCQYTEERSESTRIIDCTNDEFQFKSIDIVAMGGGGLSYLMPNDARLFVNAGLDRSLVSVDSSEAADDLKHRSWMLVAGVSYPLQPQRR